MNHKQLKIVAAGFQNYTGPIGGYEFVDGISVDALTRNTRDRLCAAFEMVEIDEGGDETPSGVAHRLVVEREALAEVVPDSHRQTEAEKSAEQRRIAAMGDKAPTEKFYTRAELIDIADKDGIKGLRAQVGDKWGVRHRSIPVLIDMVLEAQELFTAARNAKLEEKTKVETDAKSKVVVPVMPMGSASQIAAIEKAKREAAAAEKSTAGSEDGKSEEPKGETVPDALYGSSVLASTYEIKGETVQLGEIVRLAFADTQLSVEEWNNLHELDREKLLAVKLSSLQTAE